MNRVLQPFDVERMICTSESLPEYSLSEREVHPVSAREVVDDRPIVEELLITELKYPCKIGDVVLRGVPSRSHLDISHGLTR